MRERKYFYDKILPILGVFTSSFLLFTWVSNNVYSQRLKNSEKLHPSFLEQGLVRELQDEGIFKGTTMTFGDKTYALNLENRK